MEEDSSNVWAQEISPESDDNRRDETRGSDHVIIRSLVSAKSKIPDNLHKLIDECIPTESTLEKEPAKQWCLYDILDSTVNGRKTMSVLTSSSASDPTFFLHYDRSHINQEIIKTVEKWDSEEQPRSEDSSKLQSNPSLPSDYSSAIFSWSSSNKESHKVYINRSRNEESRNNLPSVNERLYNKAYKGLSKIRWELKKSEMEEVSRAQRSENNKTEKVGSELQNGFKMDPLQQFEVRALPRKYKKKQHEKKKRGSFLWFWGKKSDDTQKQLKVQQQGISSQSENTSNYGEPQLKERNDLRSKASKGVSGLRDVNSNNLEMEDENDFSGKSSPSTGSLVISNGIIGTDDVDEDTTFGEFASAASIPSSSNKSPSAIPVLPDTAITMSSFAPLKPKKKNMNRNDASKL